MPTSRKRRKSMMPIGVGVVVATEPGPKGREVVTVSRVSPRSFRWNVIDPKWREPRGLTVARTGTASTQGLAMKQAKAAWKAGV